MFYAISLGKWIEIRKANKPPKKVEGKLKRIHAQEGQRYYSALGGYAQGETRQVPYTIKLTRFDGGRYQGSVPKQRLFRQHIHLEKGEVIEITPETAAALLGQRVGR